MKSRKIPLRLWFNIILFGLMGQIAWNIENMYFNTFLYNNIYSNGATQAAVNSAIPYTSTARFTRTSSGAVMKTFSARSKSRSA